MILHCTFQGGKTLLGKASTPYSIPKTTLSENLATLSDWMWSRL